jgi:hypothetical protein
MNRRKFFALLSSLPFISTSKLLAEKKAVVSYLDLSADNKSLGYKTLCEFITEEDAIKFVQALIPRLVSITLRKHPNKIDSIRSGYRGAIRYMHEDSIHATIWEIVNKDTKEVFNLSENVHIFQVEYAWMLIASIRVNDKPVWLKERDTGMPNTLCMPFDKGTPYIHYIED